MPHLEPSPRTRAFNIAKKMRHSQPRLGSGNKAPLIAIGRWRPLATFAGRQLGDRDRAAHLGGSSLNLSSHACFLPRGPFLGRNHGRLVGRAGGVGGEGAARGHAVLIYQLSRPLSRRYREIIGFATGSGSRKATRAELRLKGDGRCTAGWYIRMSRGHWRRPISSMVSRRPENREISAPHGGPCHRPHDVTASGFRNLDDIRYFWISMRGGPMAPY